MTEPPYRLPEIPYLRLRVTLRAEEPARLPGYTGSMLRGAFGHAQRRAVCAMGPRQPCASCSLRRECVHPRLFETLVEGDPPPFLKGLPTAPRPYVFEPAQPVPGDGAGPRDLAAGEALGFDLLLFGRAVDLRWHDWERWCNRQRRPMRLGGHVGRLRLQGELAPFAQLLATAELVHVGKGATFGLGRVEVRSPGTGDAG